MSRSLRVGLVCPYSFDRPGGVQNHVIGLARALLRLGHRPAILAPGDHGAVPGLAITSTGPALPVPYNGSIARVSFGPVAAARVRRWLRGGGFDLVHLHEPITPSISLLALRFAEVPVVATYHTATPRSRTMRLAGDVLRRLVEKIDAGIAVSDAAREVVVRHLGRDAVVIPNGFDHAWFEPPPDRDECPWRAGPRPRVTFLGRLDEPRKGLAVLLAALPAIRAAVGEVDVCLAGHGTPAVRSAELGGCRVLGGISDDDKRVLLARTDVFVAPQVARESFGIVVLEALAAGAEVVASDLPAFGDLLAGPGGGSGHLFRRGDPADLAARVIAVLRHGHRRQPGAALAAARYDWSRVAPAIQDVYAASILGGAAESGRVDHRRRIQRTWSALDAALVGRAARALELTQPEPTQPEPSQPEPSQPDPARPDPTPTEPADLATQGVHRAATAALAAASADADADAPGYRRERAESELSRSLAAAGLDVLRPEHDRAALARRLHNDAVAAAVRTLRLRTDAVDRPDSPSPRAFEMADPGELTWHPWTTGSRPMTSTGSGPSRTR